MPVLSDAPVIFFKLNRSINSKWQFLGGATVALSEQYVLQKFHGQNHLQCYKDKNIPQLNKTDNERITVTLRRVRASTVSWAKQTCYIFGLCVCSLSYPACKTHAPHYVTCGLSSCTMFPHYLINGIIFGGEKKLLNTKYYVFLNSLQFSFKTFPILRRIRRDIINLHSSSGKVSVIFIRL